MKDAEQAIERVLAGLREVETPQGMEGRILRAIDERVAVGSSRKPWYVWPKMPGYAGLVASAVVVVSALTVLVIPAMHKREHLTLDALGIGKTMEPHHSIAPQKGQLRLTLKMPERTAREGRIEWLATEDYEPDIVPQRKASRGQTTLPIWKNNLKQSPRNDDRPESIPDYDALAMSEMLAPSKPAPPLPLSHQEKLLARMVHHGEPAALATLRADERARQMEISKAEFEDFFTPVLVKGNE